MDTSLLGGTEYSTAVPASQQKAANSGFVDSLGGFLNGLAAIATPIASVVNAFQAPKAAANQNVGDGYKAPTPVANTPTAAQPGLLAGIDQKTLLVGGGALALVLVIALVATRK